MPPQRRKSSIGGSHPAPTRNPLADEAEHTPPVSPLRDAEWHSTAVTPGAATTPPTKAAAKAAMVLPPAMTAESPAAMFITPSSPGDAPTVPAPGPADGEAARGDGDSAAPIAKPVPPKGKAAEARVRGIDPALRSVGTTLRGAATASPSVLTMPLPAAGDGPLNASELEQLDLCESSIDALRVAFWVAGRALQIVRDGRLYRAGHATFDDYVEKRWDMQRSYAHKLIRAWPLAARLHPVAPSINEGQIRELLPIVAAHGEDAAFTVYTTLAADVKVTAGKLREAVAVLPHNYDRSEVVQRLQSWMRGDLAEDTPHTPDVFSTAESRLAALTSKVVKGSTEDPVAAREFAAKLRTLAELIEQQIPV
ncbi:hypothetical protein OHB26_15665 [Nocardia sp. NBC_01503]|uniref:hypothetical protein n=1 Tax=Nocardia sp. NBC_01503 TaxID=2975997 RepID=UPI002E7B7DB5|nr:hypothetical protein [Nocardia sp. NBC_01503]WTL35500.1 hypothetical protein OHB26_15665 [Nocardia sp. NBC_01503]